VTSLYVAGALIASTAVGRAAYEPSANPQTALTEISQPARPGVLVVFSDDASQSWVRDLSDGFIQATSGLGADAPALYFEFLDAVRFDPSGQPDPFRAAIRDKYRGRRLDLIVPFAENAIDFVAQTHTELWSDVPVLFTSYSGALPTNLATLPNASLLAFESSLAPALETLRSVLPDTKRVALISGLSPRERLFQPALAEGIRRAGLDALDLSASTMSAILERVGRLPDDTVVFIAGGQLDANGIANPTWPVCEQVSSAANRPVFMMGSQFLGCGIVGGRMRDYKQIGQIAGRRALRLLSGGAPINELVPTSEFTVLKFDSRQLERWNIPARRLPAGSEVEFRRSNVWRDYRWQLIAVLAGIVLQSALIVGLLYERRWRHTAERESRRTLALAAHFDRRAAIGELTSSLTHELSHPLGSIMHNAAAADLLLASNRAEPEELREILRDIRSEDVRASEILSRLRAMLKGRELEKRPVDLNTVVRETLAIIAHDASERDVRIESAVSPSPCLTAGDQVHLQQVVLNLALNAMDAMARVSDGQRRLRISTRMTGEGPQVTVRDTGPGVPEQIANRLFDPFVTTKEQGLGVGLSISRSIIQAHGGRIEATNDQGGGAIFRFTLPPLSAAKHEAAHL
jgi:signal transduction histidine kinase